MMTIEEADIYKQHFSDQYDAGNLSDFLDLALIRELINRCMVAEQELYRQAPQVFDDAWTRSAGKLGL